MTVKTANRSAPFRAWHGIPEALLLGLGLMLASFSRIVGDVNSMAFQHKVIDSVFAGPIWGTAFGNNVIVCVLTLTALHAAAGLVCWLLARVSRAAWPAASVTLRQWLLVWYILTVAWLLVANAALYPNSSLGSPYAQAVRAGWAGMTPFSLASVLLASAVALACTSALLRIPRTALGNRKLALAAGALTICTASLALVPADVKSEPAVSGKPHVIVIGIDSLRSDSVGGETPAIAGFLRNAATFTDAITPLARTFPSWVSLLTGRHPHTTGAVMNLLPRDLVRTGETLPETLRRAGYATAYAIDEVRFSNIDASYGFDKLITPPMGATEFVLGRIVDTPVSNLVMNTWLGAIAFPHLHANRGAAVTYDPDSFVRRLESELVFDRPTFLALHLTLAHWPFTWSDTPKAPRQSGEARVARYPQAVERVDRQFRDVMRVLEQKGALGSALVIVMSDHGEALGLESDSVIPASQRESLLKLQGKMFGHGTSVFSPPQYQVVLGIRTYGAALRAVGPRVLGEPVSLEDIAPTVVDLIGVTATGAYDGRSLAPLLASAPGATDALQERIRFTETEFNPQDVFVAGDVSESGAAKAALFYRVDPSTDRVELRREHLKSVLDQRQYAAMLGDELLAALPEATPGTYTFVAVDRRRGLPRTLTTAPAESLEPRMFRLWHALHARFQISSAGHAEM